LLLLQIPRATFYLGVPLADPDLRGQGRVPLLRLAERPKALQKRA